MQPIAFSTSTFSTIFWLAFGIWCLPEFLGAFFQRSKNASANRDRGTYPILLVTSVLGMALAFWLAYKFPAGTIQWHPRFWFFLGAFLAIAGVVLRWYSIHLLGASFTRNLAVQSGQKIVQDGPYRYIRHPSYTGILLTMLGIGLALGNWASLAAALLIKLIGLLYRVSMEERALCEVLGQPYRDYMKHTRRFIPYIY